MLGTDYINRRRFMSAATLACCASFSSAAVVKRDLPDPDMKFISDKMDFHKRADWTDQEAKAWRMRGIGAVDRITIHHTGGNIQDGESQEDVVYALQGVLSAHSQRGYGDLGYHLVVDCMGRVWGGRSIAYEGAHVQDENERNIGIMLLGNFELQKPSVPQLASMKALVNILRDKYRIKRHRIYGHRDLGASACPGANLYSYVQKLKEGKL